MTRNGLVERGAVTGKQRSVSRRERDYDPRKAAEETGGARSARPSRRRPRQKSPSPALTGKRPETEVREGFSFFQPEAPKNPEASEMRPEEGQAPDRADEIEPSFPSPTPKPEPPDRPEEAKPPRRSGSRRKYAAFSPSAAPEREPQTAGEPDAPPFPETRRESDGEEPQAPESSAEPSEEGETGAAAPSRLRFTPDELPPEETDKPGGSKKKDAKKLSQARRRAARLEEQWAEARASLPARRKLRLEKETDQETGRKKRRLTFKMETQSQYAHVKGPLPLRPVKAGMNALIVKAHKELYEAERDNVGVEAAHRSELAAEGVLRFAAGRHKTAPYRKAARLERKTSQAKIRSAYLEWLQKNPEKRRNPLSRNWQKHRIKRRYAKAQRQSRRAGRTVKQAAAAAGKAVRAAAAACSSHPVVFGGLALLILLIFCCFSSCTALGNGVLGAVAGTSYFSADEDLLQTDKNYTALETGLKKQIAAIEREYPDYHEYRYDVDEIGHNPYALASYLTVLYETYTPDQVKGQLQALFDEQYDLKLTEEVEVRTRTRTKTWTDENGVVHEETWEEPYDYYILHIILRNKTLPRVIRSRLDDTQWGQYLLLMEFKGNKPYLWDDVYTGGGADPGSPDYRVPGEALSDPDFSALLAEAEKYLGYPYVWGGSNPATSFDCSGFVCWVYSQSGVYDLPRTTAQGIYNQCAVVPDGEARPGDLVFFTGTYASSGPVSHIGIYVGNGMMMHAGDPIKYSNINTAYWQEHLYGFGRLNI